MLRAILLPLCPAVVTFGRHAPTLAPMNLPPNSSIGIIERLVRLVTSLKTQEVFLVMFIALLILALGTLTGYIPSPLLTLIQQHNQQQQTEARLVEIAELSLYLQREACLHDSETSTERARCDRQSIRDIILSSGEDEPFVSTVTARPPATP